MRQEASFHRYSTFLGISEVKHLDLDSCVAEIFFQIKLFSSFVKKILTYAWLVF